MKNKVDNTEKLKENTNEADNEKVDEKETSNGITPNKDTSENIKKPVTITP